MMPVADRVIGAEGDPLLAARRGHFLDYVAAQRRVHDVVVGLFRVEHAEAVVMLGDQHQVLHPRLPGDPDPRVGVEAGRVEMPVELVILLDGHLGSPRPADLGSLEAHRAPMYEHAEPRVAPPGEPRLVAGHGGPRRCCRSGSHETCEHRKQKNDASSW